MTWNVEMLPKKQISIHSAVNFLDGLPNHTFWVYDCVTMLCILARNRYCLTNNSCNPVWIIISNQSRLLKINARMTGRLLGIPVINARLSIFNVWCLFQQKHWSGMSSVFMDNSWNEQCVLHQYQCVAASGNIYASEFSERVYHAVWSHVSCVFRSSDLYGNGCFVKMSKFVPRAHTTKQVLNKYEGSATRRFYFHGKHNVYQEGRSR